MATLFEMKQRYMVMLILITFLVIVFGLNINKKLTGKTGVNGKNKKCENNGIIKVFKYF